MRIYLVKKVSGFYLGDFVEPAWTLREPTVSPLEPTDMRGIEWEILEDYYDYLWRLGEYSFGAVYTFGRAAPEGRLSLERFADYYYLRLWPTRVPWWSAVGARWQGWRNTAVMWLPPEPKPLETDLRIGENNIILRYKEALWWGKEVLYRGQVGQVFEIRRWIGRKLMFERRGSGVAKKNEDEWDFGMAWWDMIEVGDEHVWYLWATAEVTYLGFGVRLSETRFRLKPVGD